MQRGTEGAIDPPDADEEADGHQVALDGVEAITVTVTSADGKRMKTYRVVFEPTVTELALGPTWTAFEWLGPDRTAIDEAGLPEEVVVVYSWMRPRARGLGTSRACTMCPA